MEKFTTIQRLFSIRSQRQKAGPLAFLHPSSLPFGCADDWLFIQKDQRQRWLAFMCVEGQVGDSLHRSLYELLCGRKAVFHQPVNHCVMSIKLPIIFLNNDRKSETMKKVCRLK